MIILRKKVPDRLENYTPLSGVWLWDGPVDLSMLKFDVTDPSSFRRDLPFVAGCPKTTELIRKLREPDIFYKDTMITEFVDDEVPDENEVLIDRLFDIVRFIRGKTAVELGLRNRISWENCVREGYFVRAELSEEERAKRRKMMLAAKAVVAGYLDPSLSSRHFGTGEQNVRIWVANYLAYGPRVFFMNSREFSPVMESFILRNHTQMGWKVEHTCARFGIMSYNRFKHLCARAARVAPQS